MADIVAVYTDGGTIITNPSSIGGTWAWCMVDANGEHFTDEGICVAGAEWLVNITNNQMEFYAMLQAFRHLPDGWAGDVYSDSDVTLGRMARSWKMKQLPVKWVQEGSKQLQRLGAMKFHLLDGHPTKAQLAAGIGKRGNPVSEYQVLCDKACTRRAKRFLDQLRTLDGDI